MKYKKQPLSFDDQAQLLINRGLLVPDKDDLICALRKVNYYRLSAYWFPFRYVDPGTGEERFYPNTSLDLVWKRYLFDRRLRLLVLDALEIVEVSILRTLMVEQFTLQYGPFGYTDPSSFRPELNHARMMDEISKDVDHSKEEFVRCYRRKYTGETYLPLWMTAELMSFGQLFTFYRFMHVEEKKKIAKLFGIFTPVFESWLHTLHYVRNACAHHARLWNREIPIRPKIPDVRHQPDWHSPVTVDNTRVYAILSILKYLLGHIAPEIEWKAMLLELLSDYVSIPIGHMGFPENWFESNLWK